MSTEDQHTPPRTDCPHPEWWHADDGQGTEHEVTELVAAFVRALQPEHCIETGSYMGQTSVAIAHALHRNGHGYLDTFEIDKERAFVTHTKLAPWREYARVHECPVTDYDPIDVDFAFIDSETDVRLDEFAHMVTASSNSAVFIFHDTRFDWADQLHAMPSIRCLYLPTPRGVTIAQVGSKVTRKAHDWRT